MKIDFVITWVDGSDSRILNKKRRHLEESYNEKKYKERYRDWGIFKYFFRGLEQYAPWVNKIYLVVDNQIPKWLNTDHPKLRVVNHDEFIPKQYLPTFNTRTIELNVHKIKGLSEHFVLFNDDNFLINDVEESDFFKNGKASDTIGLDVKIGKYSSSFDHNRVNNTQVINDHFKKRRVIKNNFFNWLNFFNVKITIKTIILYFIGGEEFPGFVDTHLPVSYLKSTFSEVWDFNNEVMDLTCKEKLRSKNDVTSWVIRYWQICKGDVINRKANIGVYHALSSKSLGDVKNIIFSRKKLICLNDTENTDEFESIKTTIIGYFEEKFPNESNFELF